MSTSRAVLRKHSALGALIFVGVLTAAYLLLEPGSTPQTLIYHLVGATGVAAVLAGLALQRPSAAAPWLLMAAGQAGFVAGDVLWSVYAAQGVDPFPSTADAAYLAGYPLIAAGLLLAVRRRVAGGDRAGLLDGAILATGATLVWWSVVVGPMAALTDPEPVGFAISMAYPIGDLLLIGMALVLAVTPGARTPSFALLLASLCATLMADLLFSLQNLDGTYVDGGALDGLWLAGYGLFAAAALHPSMAEVVSPRPVTVTLLGRGRMAVLALAMLVGPTLLVVEASAAGPVILVVAIATAIVSVLVLARLAGMVRHLDRDIERRKTLEAQLAFQAFHDPLTALPNRRRFAAGVRDALARSAPVAALFVDLDDFKHVNDNFGHETGDAFLLAAAERIVGSVRPGDLVSRLGGDEFAVLLEQVTDARDADEIAARVVDAFGPPIAIDGRTVQASVSVGVAFRRVGERLSADALLRHADVAMYHAKARGKNGRTTYTSAMDTDEGAMPRLVGGGAPAA